MTSSITMRYVWVLMLCNDDLIQDHFIKIYLKWLSIRRSFLRKIALLHNNGSSNNKIKRLLLIINFYQCQVMYFLLIISSDNNMSNQNNFLWYRLHNLCVALPIGLVILLLECPLVYLISWLTEVHPHQNCFMPFLEFWKTMVLTEFQNDWIFTVH